MESDALSSYGQNTGNAQSTFGTLSPLYTRMATSPTGYTPQQMGNFNTASMQATGGSAAGAIGEGGLAAARTNNAGGFQAAVDDAARSAGITNSQNALGVQNQQAQLMQRQQAQGLEGLQSIYGTSTGAGLGYLNAADQAAQATTNANMGWTKLAMQALAGAGGA